MILRVWHGWTSSENADAYQQLLTTSIVPSIISKAIPGLVGVDILRRTDGHGTDIEFVRHEAALLDVAPYFEGGIFGALRAYKDFSKAMVIQKILKDFDLSGSELLIVGDGYVEIENAKAVGAIALGVASVTSSGETTYMAGT